MKITTLYYQFRREFFENYVIKSIGSSGHILKYDLYIVENNIEIPLTNLSLIQPGEEVTLELSTEGIYSLHIYRPDSTNPGNNVTDVYSIRYFPTIKENIITTMADAICDCSNLDDMSASCKIDVSAPVIQDVYDMQMLYNSVGLYRDMLISPSFLRPYQNVLTKALGGHSTTILRLLKKLYDNVDQHGSAPNSMQLARIYTAYMYILFYVIEEDITNYVSPVLFTGVPDPPIPAPPPNIREQEYLERIFDFDNIANCIDSLGLNFEKIYNQMKEDYKKCPFGTDGCTDTGGGVTPPPIDPPDDDDMVKNLTYVDHKEFVAVNTFVIPTRFSWQNVGNPINLKLTDSEKILFEQPVSGESYSSGDLPYILNETIPVVWTLSGDNITSIQMETTWMHKIYTGKRFKGGVPPESEIILGKQFLQSVAIEFGDNLETGKSEYGWFAIPKRASAEYTHWEASNIELNKGTIGGGPGDVVHFISVTEMMVYGVGYYIYVFNYPTKTNYVLTLYRE